jgi:hypothetical protein
MPEATMWRNEWNDLLLYTKNKKWRYWNDRKLKGNYAKILLKYEFIEVMK